MRRSGGMRPVTKPSPVQRASPKYSARPSLTQTGRSALTVASMNWWKPLKCRVKIKEPLKKHEAEIIA